MQNSNEIATVTNTENIWIIDDDQSIRWVLHKALQKAGMDITVFEFTSDLLAAITANNVEIPDAIISDIRMPGMSGLDLTKQIHQQACASSKTLKNLENNKESFRYEKGESNSNVTNIYQKSANNDLPITQQEIIGQSSAMQSLFKTIGKLSKTSISVLITGESGTGKELVAKALHTHSPRAHKPFIAINTAAIPRELLESELFGHEKGSFTGAQNQRKGRFEQADGGTLFLDEIGDMPAELQTRLLRVLADGEFYRVGGTQAINVDVRVIAATHQNLEEYVQNGTFREDLFHRLNVIRLQIPALRERDEDIIVLLNHFLVQAAKELGAEKKTLSTEVKDYLQTLKWPGNVRQLENVSRWLTVMTSRFTR